MGMWKALLVVAVIFPLCGAFVAPVAADMGAGGPALAEAQRETPDGYLRRRAVVLMIRATFNLLLEEDVPRILAETIERMGAAGPSEEDSARLDRELLTEGSYYLVSLRYLIEFGGALWPSDRPESLYVTGTLATLDLLQDQLIEAVEARADPLPILERAQAILALTEGYVDVPETLNRFDGRDAVVEEVLAEHGPIARS